jgi:predicted small metal-binding protein
MMQWKCLEAGCDVVITAEDEDELIEKVNAHVGEVHDSYELDEIILANAEEAGGAD